MLILPILGLTVCIYYFLNPKKVAIYCIDGKYISAVIQYKPTISGGDKYIRIYHKKILSRFQLHTNEYIEFPTETDVLISRKLSNNKFIISAQVYPTIVVGSYGNLELKTIKLYSEGDENNITAFDLPYQYLFILMRQIKITTNQLPKTSQPINTRFQAAYPNRSYPTYFQAA